MRLKKYQDKQLVLKRKTYLFLVLICVIGIGLLVYQSFGSYQDKVTFKLINGKLKMSNGVGDIEFTFYNGDQKLEDLPLKSSRLLYVGSSCTNGASVKWDNENWLPFVYNLTSSKTSCSLYFGSNEDRACFFHPLGSACEYYKNGETEELLYDTSADKNLRFVGSDPKNYVYFNCEAGKEQSKETCETWRIIGIMNNIEEDTGNIGSHLKIIRDSIGSYYWDSSIYYVNNGWGVNEWSEADIEKVLNNEYLNRCVGSNPCYDGSNSSIETCPDWTNIGIKEEARNMIGNIKWNTGTYARYEANGWNAYSTYSWERSKYHGKELCLNYNDKDCNDDVKRNTIWFGKIGLMYPSDYGYAVGGDVRSSCLSKSLSKYSVNCRTNDWLHVSGSAQWTISPGNNGISGNSVFRVYLDGDVGAGYATNAYAVRPTLYLKSDVKITERNYEDYGSTNHPFELSYE